MKYLFVLILFWGLNPLFAQDDDEFSVTLSEKTAARKERAELDPAEKYRQQEMTKVHLWRAGGSLTMTAGATGVFFGTVLGMAGLVNDHDETVIGSSFLFWGGIGVMVGGGFMIGKGNRIKRNYIESISLVPEVNPFDDRYGVQMVVRF